MSAEESDKPNRIPEGLQKALQRLAKQTVDNGWDPGRVAMTLYTMLKRWQELTLEQREVVRAELRRRAGKPMLGTEKRKPRRFRDDV